MPEFLTDKQIDELAETLRGTCNSLDTELEKIGKAFEMVSSECLSSLDERVMCCEQCGWWSDSDEIDGDGFCAECQVENIEHASDLTE